VCEIVVYVYVGVDRFIWFVSWCQLWMNNLKEKQSEYSFQI